MPNGSRRPERSISMTSWISPEEGEQLDQMAMHLAAKTGKRTRRVDVVRWMLARPWAKRFAATGRLR
jgi:hypothetical protein